MVAAEIKYHKPCYNSYVRVLYSKKVINELQTNYEESYREFLKYIEKKIFTDGKVVFLKHLLSKFVEIVKKVEKKDASSYSSARLKTRLKQSFPRLVFQRPSTRSISEIVFAIEYQLGDSMLSDVEMQSQSQSDGKDSDSEEDYVYSKIYLMF